MRAIADLHVGGFGQHGDARTFRAAFPERLPDIDAGTPSPFHQTARLKYSQTTLHGSHG